MDVIWAFLALFEAILAKYVSKKPISCKFGRKTSGTTRILIGMERKAP